MAFTLTKFNDRLAALKRGYSARYSAGDQMVDAQIEILLHGVATRWALQVGHGYAGINEYGFDANGEIEWMEDHGYYQTVDQAARQLLRILAKENGQ